ncbi:zinc finger CCCH domain-containing protein 32-like [Andrographis paniculata]|uniref:zinc finger CCCH domain-containing protein 32-like n=1 Tax=Andrographis paniculata TaxID=175694 RepID=UPI0021E78078|nr:zinc finger CCCH domain-containing protein 32-like [Andrographis paniculata]
MVGSASQSQPQPPSAEEEALRRNTDCVYFLASPLTCKKGSECEYRHSDIARVNPRDCWYWINGNCLNSKCAFRHPPLDGLLGTPTSSGPSVPASSLPAPAATSSAKQPVSCIFFQKGFCLKGDWCPFLHLQTSIGNKASAVTGAASTLEQAAAAKKVFTAVQKPLQEKKSLPVNVAKSVKDSQPLVKPLTKAGPAPWTNELSMNRKVPQTADFPGYRSTPMVSNGNPVNWPGRVQQSNLLDEPEGVYGKDTEEVSREPSPGFDVLVDDEGRDSDYYPSEDRYGMPMEHEARNEYNMDHPTDYNMVAAIEDERYGNSIGYDPQDLHSGGQYAWDQRGRSAERILGGSYSERRPYDRPDSRGRVDESDLRHRLARHRKPNGLRSVISREHPNEMHVRDREQRIPHVKPLSNRLQGRIRLPRRSLSPIRAGAPNHQGRIRSRIIERRDEDFNNGVKNYRGMHSRKDNNPGDDRADFAGPKSLAELKNRKNGEPLKQQRVADRQSFGKRKQSMIDGNQQSGSDVLFEGPKPLEEILKRKRGETTGNLSARNLSNNQDVAEDTNYEGKNEDHKSTINAEAGKQPALSSPKQAADDGAHAENRLEQEPEACDDRDGEPEYEQGGGEDYEVYDGENGDGSGEYIEEEDDDDEFAKKMGVVYS